MRVGTRDQRASPRLAVFFTAKGTCSRPSPAPPPQQTSPLCSGQNCPPPAPRCPALLALMGRAVSVDPPAPVTNQQTEATRAKPGEAADLAAAGHGAAGEGLRRGGPVWGGRAPASGERGASGEPGGGCSPTFSVRTSLSRGFSCAGDGFCDGTRGVCPGRSRVFWGDFKGRVRVREHTPRDPGALPPAGAASSALWEGRPG